MSKECNGNDQFLFDIIEDVKYFYETPVIYVTKRDFGDEVFNILCKLRSGQLNNIDNTSVMDLIVDFHLQWLQAISEIECFKQQINTYHRNDIHEVISFTIDSLNRRKKHLRQYVDSSKKSLNGENQRKLRWEMEIVEAMSKEVTYTVLEILTCFRNFTDDTEFYLKLNAATNNLMTWLDKIIDHVCIHCTKYFKITRVDLSSELISPLRKHILDLSTSSHSSALDFMNNIKLNGLTLSDMIRSPAVRNLEISKITELINTAEDRIKILGNQNTSVAADLNNKKMYLQQKLEFLKKCDTTLSQIFVNAQFDKLIADNECACLYEARIFNHLLPITERERLVTDLCYLWDKALCGQRSRKSIISILSATSVREKFTDNLGTFYVDEYGRKIYIENDNTTLYQLNEENKLVPLNDDEQHIYYYDECGRYYIDSNTHERIYKLHATASEYIMGPSGSLFKVKEVLDNVTYYYDSYGRYYINENGKHIYRDGDSNSEYEQDGYGNLVRIRSQLDIFELCPDDSQVSEDSKYLKETIGRALRESLAMVIIQQPEDPIKYLSALLKKYRENLELQEKRKKEEEELLLERKILFSEQCAIEDGLETLPDGVSENSYDSNLLKYKTLDIVPPPTELL